MGIRLDGGSVLCAGRFMEQTTIRIEDDRIAGVGTAGNTDAVYDASGLLVLPGIVDLHADAVERAIEPRPGVRVPLPLALAEHDASLLANGITTCCLSLTDGFEPGMRSRAMLRDIMGVFATPGLRLTARLPLHIRREICAAGEVDDLLRWIDGGRITLLSLCDHVPAADDDRAHVRFIASLRRRLGAHGGELERIVEEARRRRADGQQVRDVLCQAACEAGVVLAAHDDATPDQAEASASRGIAISEFPLDLPTAQRARKLGSRVLMGAPNVVRGGSHIGCLGATTAIAAGICDALCSDYHHPSLFQAPFTLVSAGVCSLADAWGLVSTGPAAAARMDDRGRIAPGQLADLVLVEPGPRPRVRSVWVGGREVARFA
jgi:alpha-D-ribose 1-methylphosphonate 5-triphosphate diphosphatase